MQSPETTNQQMPLVQAQHLKKYFKITKKKTLHAVDDVSFDIYPGETLGLVGESGCGKSTVGNVIMRLLQRSDGKLLYRGKDIFTADRKTVRAILSEAFEIHHYGTKEEIAKAVEDLCERVQIPLNLLDHFPHELDGGMRQIVGIARALSLNADFIVCDEPVSSLDVSIQARIVNLLMDLQKKMGLSYLFISHDLSVVRHISNRIAVMYLGLIVEIAETDEMFANTCHPYSVALLSAVPRVNVDKKVSRIVLKGDVPSPVNPKPGCRFAPRCWMAQERCFQEAPEMSEVAPGHCVACHFAHETRERMKTAEISTLAD